MHGHYFIQSDQYVSSNIPITQARLLLLRKNDSSFCRFLTHLKKSPTLLGTPMSDSCTRSTSDTGSAWRQSKSKQSSPRFIAFRERKKQGSGGGGERSTDAKHAHPLAHLALPLHLIPPNYPSFQPSSTHPAKLRHGRYEKKNPQRRTTEPPNAPHFLIGIQSNATLLHTKFNIKLEN